MTGGVFEHLMNDIESAKTGFIAVWNKFNEEFDVLHSLNMNKMHSLEKNDPLCAWLIDNRSSLLVRDMAKNPEFDGRFYSARSFIASPFIHDSEVFGFIFLGNPHTKKAFNYSHMILLSAVCNQLAARLRDIEEKTEDACRKRLAQIRF
ncbi:MAG: GAF domain-containing protein [Nitrospirae bacterium]|nr:GAF domain-containing protein [Nitrospirota bacterium]